MKYYFCIHCSKPNQLKRSKNGAFKFCSNVCQREFEFNIKYELWLEGEVNIWSHRNPISFKRAIERRDGYFCSECKINKWNDKHITLEIEHKDGNSENSNPNNLCLICPNCHSQTLTYKAKNIGKGRYFRKQRYKNKESF